MNQRLCHEIAFNYTFPILNIFNLRDEEKHEAFGAVYDCVRAALITYDEETRNLLHRLKPLEN